MFSDTRRRLIGLAAAIVVPTALGFMALPAHALSPADPVTTSNCATVPGNLVVNCGFEAGPQGTTAPGWTHTVSIGSGVVHNGSVAAHAGSNDLVFASESGDDVWTQTIPVSPHTQYLIGAWFQVTDGAASSATDDLTFSATNVGTDADGTTIYQTRNTLLTGWHQGDDIITTGSGHSMTLTLAGSNGPGDSFVDDVYVAPQRSGCVAIANNLVANCGFEASTSPPTLWALTGINHDTGVAPEGSIPGASEGGTQSLFFGSSSGDDAWTQVLPVRAHTTYTLTYWTEYWSEKSTPVNDLKISVSNASSAVGGTLMISNTNVPDHVWASVTKTFTTGAGTSATLTVAGANSPGFDYVDDVSVTAVPHLKISAKGRSVTTNLTGLGGQKVMLQHLIRKHWITFHTWTAPKTGWSKSWILHVTPGRLRATAASAPGYGATSSNAITVK